MNGTDPQRSGVVFSALSMLLDYPSDALLDALPSIRTCLSDAKRLTKDTRAGLERFFVYVVERDLLTLQENYVGLFDRGRATSLYLFEHVHGESRDRGQAMVDLLQMYEKHGLYLNATELPDYLPVFLEYLSRLPERDARNLLGETAEILRSIAAQLVKRGSHYSVVVGAVLALAGVSKVEVPDAFDDDDALVKPDAADYRALDASYTDEPVQFLGAATPATEPVRFYDKRPGR